MGPTIFHPAVADWFARSFSAPTPGQAAAWPQIAAGRHTLIAAPTGSGKTLAAFLAAIDRLVREGVAGRLDDTTRVVYVSPLKALSNDVRRNLEQPLDGIRERLRAAGLPDVELRGKVRTGDTPASERAAMLRRPPHLLVTTPESLYILLTSDGGRAMLGGVDTVIVDEIHAVAGEKRGAHLALSLERLEQLVRTRGGRLQRIGLSATQRPIDAVARFLVGAGGLRPDGTADCAIVDTGHRRALDLAVEVPPSPLEAVMSAEVWTEVYDRIAALAAAHRTTLVFVNTRRLAERVARNLGERLGPEQVASHHGSLAYEQRRDAEQRLKAGALRALVATASLELGIDIGDVDLVCTLGSTRSVATLLQRVGRSGHQVGAVPKGRIFPTSRDELIECVALVRAVRAGDLECLTIPPGPLDILAQQLVAEVACGDRDEQDLFDTCRRAWPYRELTRDAFDAVVRTLAEGYSVRQGRRGAWLHHDAVHCRLRPRRGARLAALTSGGAIPDAADYRVVLEPQGTFVGTVDEDFAVESMAGDIFQLGNTSWRIRRVEHGRVLVSDARGEPPTIPFWFGEAPSRSDEASAAVAALRVEIGRRAGAAPQAAVDWLGAEIGLAADAAEQLVEYVTVAEAALGVLPDRTTIVLERFFDEAGNQHLVLHAPFGARVNRAWGLALRKRFCRTFNFELQAAATEDAIVLSLGPTHSFPGEQVFGMLRADGVREVLVQALLDAPMFAVRWRWNAGRALAVLRMSGGKRVPPRLQRMRAEDLLSLVFPDQLACLENIAGDREIPDHPLVSQTIEDCLHEAMDVAGLERLLRAFEAGQVRGVVRDLREPSPLAHEVLNARPYAFLDDAPLEERRTQAVAARRWLDAETARDLGRLDQAAIDAVREEARPAPRDADELHDALLVHGYLTEVEGRAAGAEPWLEALSAVRRAGRLELDPHAPTLWVAAERVPEWTAVAPAARRRPVLVAPPAHAERAPEPEDALSELLRGRLEAAGPITVPVLAAESGLPPERVAGALVRLEAEGFAMRGRFSPDAADDEWCDRRLLARIHRRTLQRLRREIEPVTPAELMRFLFAWQRVEPAERVEGPEGLAAVLAQLEGFAAPAAAWESELLPARIEGYDPAWLDMLCLSGRVVWQRAAAPRELPRSGPVSTTPLALLSRENLTHWRRLHGSVDVEALPPDTRRVHDWLIGHGASFFAEIVDGSGLLRTRVESALADLVAAGLAGSDSFTGLRALLTPSSRRPALDGKRRRSTAAFGMEHAGRWSLIAAADGTEGTRDPETVETVARALLRRYGVVFRALLAREELLPGWGALLRCFRRLEDRGEIRGGRFVDGFSGEQFALPEALGRLRALRKQGPGGEPVSISAADPLNLVGVVLPGERIPAQTGNRVLFRDGGPIAAWVARDVRWFDELSAAEQWPARNALLRRRVPPQLRAYLGRPA